MTVQCCLSQGFGRKHFSVPDNFYTKNGCQIQKPTKKFFLKVHAETNRQNFDKDTNSGNQTQSKFSLIKLNEKLEKILQQQTEMQTQQNERMLKQTYESDFDKLLTQKLLSKIQDFDVKNQNIGKIDKIVRQAERALDKLDNKITTLSFVPGQYSHSQLQDQIKELQRKVNSLQSTIVNMQSKKYNQQQQQYNKEDLIEVESGNINIHDYNKYTFYLNGLSCQYESQQILVEIDYWDQQLFEQNIKPNQDIQDTFKEMGIDFQKVVIPISKWHC